MGNLIYSSIKAEDETMYFVETGLGERRPQRPPPRRQPPEPQQRVSGGLPLPPEIQRFLDRVKRSPHDYEAVLLISILDDKPWYSDPLIGLRPVIYSATKTDNPTESHDRALAMEKKVLQALQAIHTQHLRSPRNKDYSRLFNKEKQLITVVASVFQKQINELKTQNPRWLEDILTRALRADVIQLVQVGRDFVVGGLPREIAESFFNSRVPEIHYRKLGLALRSIAGARQKGP
jgi:hypothetical protein